MTTAPAPRDIVTARARRRLAGWCLVIAASGTPATVAIYALGDQIGVGAAVIGTITVAALGTARAFMSTPHNTGDLEIDQQ